MKVRVVKQHILKAPGFFEKCQGKEFMVIWKRDGGYDVELAPLGFPGKWGFMYDDEVEETDQSSDFVGLLAEHEHNGVRDWVRTHSILLSSYQQRQRNMDGSFTVDVTIRSKALDQMLKQIDIPYDELSNLQKIRYRNNAVGKLDKIVSMFKTA